jgi:hypothetical protein
MSPLLRKQQRAFSPSPPLSPKGAANRSFTARIEGAHSDCAASASKKDRLAAPCPRLSEQEDDQAAPRPPC